jgi:hypothetical protein
MASTDGAPAQASDDPGRSTLRSLPSRPISRVLAIATALVALLAGASSALANEPESTETLDAPWSATGPGSVALGSNGTSPPATMSYSIKPAGIMTPRTWSFSTTAAEAGTKNLTYNYAGWHGSLQWSTVFLKAFVTHGGTTTYMPLASSTLGANGSYSYSGDISLEVQSGDTYGFRFGGESDDYIFNEMNGGLTVGLQNGLPVNTALPEIEGLPYVAGQLSATPGSWQSFRGAVSYTYQWLRCGGGGSCSPIFGDTGSTLVPDSNLVGSTLRVNVTAHNGAGESTAQSASTAVVPEVEFVEAYPWNIGAESAELVGMVEFVAGPGGQQVPPFSELCSQWRRSAEEAWSQQCTEVWVSTEFSVGCFDVGMELIYCNTPVPMTGLWPGTEYEVRMVMKSNGQEGASPVGTIFTEGEGPPRAEAGPPISGSWQAGETMEATSPGSWSGLQPIAYSYSWERCTGEPRVCAPIAEADQTTFQIPEEDVAETGEAPSALRLRVTASNSYTEVSTTSEEHEELAAPATFTTTEPALSGEAEQGQTLTIAHYAIAGAPTPSESYKWQRCDAGGESCEAIAGAREPSYALTSEDVGHTVRAVVHASNAEYLNGREVEESTEPSDVVAAVVVPCSAGSYSPTGAEPCLPATPGHYAPGSGATVQFPCVAGTYNPESSSTSTAACLSTPPGAWSGKAAAAYTKCPAGSYQPVYSAAAAGACLPDPPGTSSAEFAWEVNPCHAGTYAEGTGNAACTAAQPGHFVEADEAVTQAPCEPGTFAAHEASTLCEKAPAGWYAAGEANTTPTSCPAGTFAEVKGSIGCATTPPNTYSAGGAAKPTPCPTGTEAPSGAGACTPKPAAVPEPEPEHEAGSAERETESSSSKVPTGDGANPPAQNVGTGGRLPNALPPVLSRLSVAHRCVAPEEVARATKRAGSKSRKGPSIGFRLNEAAKVTYTLSRLKTARRPNCHATTAHGHTSARTEPISTGHAAYGPGAGSLSIARLFDHARSRKLAPGPYELTLTASNAAGERSAPASLDLWVLPGRTGRRR